MPGRLLRFRSAKIMAMTRHIPPGAVNPNDAGSLALSQDIRVAAASTTLGREMTAI